MSYTHFFICLGVLLGCCVIRQRTTWLLVCLATWVALIAGTFYSIFTLNILGFLGCLIGMIVPHVFYEFVLKKSVF